MLGVIVGLVSAIGIITFLNRDPLAVQKHREELKKLKEEQEAEERKLVEEKEKIANDPEAIKRRQEKKKQMKERMLKGLSENERKLIDEYMDEKKNEGKTEEQIMKEAGTKALLFFIFLMLIVVVIVFALLLIAGGDMNQVLTTLSNLGTHIKQLLVWCFPKLKAIASTGEQQL